VRPLSRSPRKALYFLLFSTSEDHSIASARRVKPRSAGGPQLRKSGGTELRKSAGTHPRKSGGSNQRKFCTIALINAIGNLGGYVGPFVVGWIKDSTNSFEAGLYFLAA
jgi:hypothetical protein